jgi:hypothetical protein
MTMNFERQMTRRAMMTQAGQWALGTAGLAMGLPASARQDGPRVLVGSGEHTYECFHDWLMPPPDILWGDTQGVAQDSRGRIYITHTVHPQSPKKDAIVVFDKNGKFLSSWGSRFEGGGHGLDIRKEGRDEFAYHCDTKNRLVVKTTLDGTVVWERGVPVEANLYKDNAPFVPTNVAFSPNGDLYVADGYGSNWIHQYTFKGDWIRSFGGTGNEPGKLRTPHAIWVDNRPGMTRGAEPLLVVTDRTNSRLQYFTLDGKPMGVVTAGMRQPCQIHLRDNLMLIPDLKSVVTLMDSDNKVVAQLGDGEPSALRGKPRAEFIPGKFIHPHGAKFLQDGSIVVVEWIPIGRVTLLKKHKG